MGRGAKWCLSFHNVIFLQIFINSLVVFAPSFGLLRTKSFQLQGACCQLLLKMRAATPFSLSGVLGEHYNRSRGSGLSPTQTKRFPLFHFSKWPLLGYIFAAVVYAENRQFSQLPPMKRPRSLGERFRISEWTKTESSRDTRQWIPLNFRLNLNFKLILIFKFYFFPFYAIPARERRVDGQADRQTDIPTTAIKALCMASYANAL